MMRRTWIATVLAALALLALAACGSVDTSAPPDLTGYWVQPGEANFYQVATITDDTIKVYWHVSEDDSEYLYWSGTFVAPENGKTPYTWESVNNVTREEWTAWTIPDETKSFTYSNERISYNVTMGNLRVSMGLEKQE